MTRTKIVFFLWLVALGAATPAAAQTLRIATGDYAPFTDASAADGGQVNGFVAQAASDAGFDVKFDYLPWKRSLELTRAGRYAATSFWYFDPEREADFIHVGPILGNRIVFFVRATHPLPEWSQLSDLDNIVIGAVEGYTYTDDFWSLAATGEITVELAQSDAANMRKLLAGRIDAYPMSEIAGLVLLDDILNEQERGQIVIAERPLATKNGFLLVSRAQDEAEEIAARLQRAMAHIRVAGH